MKKHKEIELKVGIFIMVSVILTMIALFLLGGGNGLARQNKYHVHFKSVEGLFTGARVVLAGVNVGQVEAIEFDSERVDIDVTITLDRKMSGLVRKDSEAELLTLGVLGDKYIAITAGAKDQPELPPGGEIPPRASKNIMEVLSQGDKLLMNLNSISTSLDHLLKSLETENQRGKLFENMATTAKNLSVASHKLKEEMEELNLKKLSKGLGTVIEKVNNGSGTLGALVNDPSLYDDMKSLFGGVNRNRVVRNLVRRTVKEGEEAEAKAPQPKGTQP